MSDRFLGYLGAALVILTPLSGQSQPGAKATPAAKKTWNVPRTPDGHPDLQGIWTNATVTPLERPAALAGKATLTGAEAREWEKKDAETNDADKDESPILARAGSAGTGFYNNLFVDRGSELARVDGVKRTALIVDPPDGKIPVRSDRPPARRLAQGAAYDDVKNRPLGERCLVGFGSTSGPPMLPVLYNNNYQIVQTPDYVMILVEMVHDVRIIRLNGTHQPKNVTAWLGDSIGHWEGDTLVVETANFHEGNGFRGSSENLTVTERFKRVDAETILYRATIDDPATFLKPWTLEYPFKTTAGPIFEYACHEGNYALPDILSGARKLESEKPPKE